MEWTEKNLYMLTGTENKVGASGLRRQYINKAIEGGYDFVIIALDGFDHSEYPVYANTDNLIQKKQIILDSPMDRILEIIDVSKHLKEIDFDKNPSKEWLEKAGDFEDSCKSVSVGGLMNTLEQAASFNQNNYDLVKRIYKEKSVERNIDSLIEEMAEITVLFLHIRRNRTWTREELVSEIADIEKGISFAKKDFNISENEMIEQHKIKDEKFKKQLDVLLSKTTDLYDEFKH